jgi:Glycosyl hydrolase catalytic core
MSLAACSSDSTSTNAHNDGGSSGSGGSDAMSTSQTNGESSMPKGGAGGTVTSTDPPSLGGTSGSLSTSSVAQNARHLCKRGIAYGHHSDADIQALSPSVVWWYNWYYAPDDSLTPGYAEQLSIEYVPMVWGPSVKLADATKSISNTATALLGYNEPNFFAQANVSASDAAKQWPEIEAIADAKHLRLVSPAVNYCGGGCHDTDPFSYLKSFFKSCASCRVDIIAAHIYVGCQISNGNHAQWLIDHLEKYQREFKEPIWLTEFACNDARNVAEQKAFLEDAVAYLEATSRIERYAWFAGRADNVPYVDLLSTSGKLTELGQAYVNAPANPECQP